jgi:hypothetical protein
MLPMGPGIKRTSRQDMPGKPRLGQDKTTALTEEGEDKLRRLVGDRERLGAQLLLDLQRLKTGAFLRKIRIDQVRYPLLDHIVAI